MNDYTLIVMDGAFGSGVACTVDILRAAASMAPRFGSPTPRWRICSVGGGTVVLESGLQVATAKLEPAHAADGSTWIIPGLGLNTEADVEACRARPDVHALIPLLRAHVDGGGKVAAACSSVFLLGFAGVLAGRRATTTWWLAPLLQRLNPRCSVEARRLVCVDGPIASASAAFAQTDLMLHLVRHTCGASLVRMLCRVLMVDARNAQWSDLIPEVLAMGDELIARLVARIEHSLPSVPSVAALAKEFCVSERTLARHVRRATGHSTRDLLQSVRLRRARALLEHSRMPVEQVAAAVGYGDPTALRRLMRRRSGAKPSQFRPAPAAAAA